MRSGFLVGLLIAAMPTHAALIDNGVYTSDTTSGLEWLDLNLTAGISATQALSENTGWRFATNSEVESLFAISFDGYYNTGTSNSSLSSADPSSDQDEDIETWISLFGLTEPAPSEYEKISRGMYLDENGSWKYIGVVDGTTYNLVYGIDYTDGAAIEAFGGNPFYGTLLVRSTVVPIPAAAWLFGSALAGLGWLRRRSIS